MNPKNGNENYPVAKVQKQSDLFYVLFRNAPKSRITCMVDIFFSLQITSYDHSIEFS